MPLPYPLRMILVLVSRNKHIHMHRGAGLLLFIVFYPCWLLSSKLLSLFLTLQGKHMLGIKGEKLSLSHLTSSQTWAKNIKTYVTELLNLIQQERQVFHTPQYKMGMTVSYNSLRLRKNLKLLFVAAILLKQSRIPYHIAHYSMKSIYVYIC